MKIVSHFQSNLLYLLLIGWSATSNSGALTAMNTPFSVDRDGVHLTDFELKGSKVIYDNDFFDDIVDHTLFMALSSLGYVDLVGIIVTRDMWEGYPNAFGMPGAKHAVKRAGDAGMRNIPVPVAGSMVRIDVEKPEMSAGSALIIQEARKCSRQKPLAVFVGGNATTVVSALIQAPDIAERMMVFTLNLGHYNGTDQDAVYQLCKRAKVVNWAWDYFYPKEACFKDGDPRFVERIPPLPGSLQNSESPGWAIKDYFLNDLLKRNIVHVNQIGDGPTLVWLLNNKCFTRARKWRVTGGRGGEVVTEGDDWDVLDIFDQNYALMGDTFFEWMSKEGIYSGSGFQLPRTMVVPKVEAGIRIDGKLDEPQWEIAGRSTPFFLNDASRPGTEKTEVRVCYDEQALYLGWVCEDRDIQATFTERDSKFWEEEVVEFFVTPDALEKYYELQWNPLNAVFDAIILNTLNEEGFSARFTGQWDYTARGMSWQVVASGTPSNSTDDDSHWIVETRIPFADLGVAAPVSGEAWRANFYRFNRDKERPVELLSWSPTRRPGFHEPNCFGYLRFSGPEK